MTSRYASSAGGGLVDHASRHPRAGRELDDRAVVAVPDRAVERGVDRALPVGPPIRVVLCVPLLAHPAAAPKDRVDLIAGGTARNEVVAERLIGRTLVATVNLAKVGSGLSASISHWRFGNVERSWVLPLAIPAERKNLRMRLEILFIRREPLHASVAG